MEAEICLVGDCAALSIFLPTRFSLSLDRMQALEEAGRFTTPDTSTFQLRQARIASLSQMRWATAISGTVWPTQHKQAKLVSWDEDSQSLSIGGGWAMPNR